MEISSILVLGVAAGILQLLGYILYIRNEEIEPQPVTWFMFAYGTAILTILEWDSDATAAELILPSICAVLAIYVSYTCWKKARIINPHKWWPEDWWPEDRWERYSFISDIAITIGYVLAWGFASIAILSLENKELAVFLFLFLSNVSTFPSFYPLLKSSYNSPKSEHWLPWTIWAIAYALLAVLTYSIHNEFWHALMFYPVSNALLHGLVGWFARPRAVY